MSAPPNWTPESWRSRPIQQQPRYPEGAGVEEVLARVRDLPPLVSAGEIDRLRADLAAAGEGRAFVLHGGDCAERFAECEPSSIVRKLKILLQMSLVLTHGLRKPVVRIGRLAGQFAKPRSSDLETQDGVELPTYRGDLINDLPFDAKARAPDPERLLTSYFHAAATLNFIRALLEGGFADLHRPDDWQLDFMGKAEHRGRFQAIADHIVDAIDFFEKLGGVEERVLQRVELYTSHEGLHLPYEHAFVHALGDAHYNLGAHFLWIGDRTRDLDGAHVELFRGLSNPIGVKLGPTCRADELSRLVEVLNPDDIAGRLTLITRYGRAQIEAHLPEHIAAVRRTARRVVWSCDPMHGNAIKTPLGVKTRNFADILVELTSAFDIHEAEGSALAGVHFELTGDNVTECIGGAQGLVEADLAQSYATGCDPRLNYAQSLEMAFLIADLIRKRRTP